VKLIVSKSRLEGAVAIPASKSHTIRAVAIASLADGTSTIRNPLVSSDTLSAVNCYRLLGAAIDTDDPQAWHVTGTAGQITPPEEIIDVGNSGTTLRIAIASAALSTAAAPVRFTGDRQIRSRPVQPLLDAIKNLGAGAFSLNNNGSAPVEVSGTLTGGRTAIECITSQYLSSLLLAAPLAEGNTEINVTLLNEPDYVRMTLDWLDRQQIRYENRSMKRFVIPGGQAYKSFDTAIGADFSSATFFLCAGALVGNHITVEGLDFSDSQPDKAVVEYLRQMGADIRTDRSRVIVKGAPLHGTTIDMNRTPDALPAMAVVAAFARGTTRLTNVPQARKKETDRIACMAQELRKLNVDIEELPDGLVINGPARLRPVDLDGRDDHRIVMALALAATAVDGKTVIDTAQAINVTFPRYVDLMNSIGADMKMTE
jgi:3-phosphoshikimate 1-carboxyvinyltransferase